MVKAVMQKGETMDEYISRQKAIEEIYQLLKELPNKKNSALFKDGVRDGYARAIGRIRIMPSAQPRKKGKWIRTRTMIHDGELYCDQCGQEHPEQKKIWNFCPNCGADMREGDAE